MCVCNIGDHVIYVYDDVIYVCDKVRARSTNSGGTDVCMCGHVCVCERESERARERERVRE